MKIHTIRLLRDELVLNIRQIAYIMAKSSADAVQAKHDADISTAGQDDVHTNPLNIWMTDIFQRGGQDTMNDEVATREMNLAVHTLAHWLRDHLDREIEGDERERTDRIRFPEEYHLHMNVPDDYKKVTAKLLEDLCHKFVAINTLMSWSMYAAPEYSERLAVMYNDTENKLVDAISDMEDGGYKRPAYPVF